MTKEEKRNQIAKRARERRARETPEQKEARREKYRRWYRTRKAKQAKPAPAEKKAKPEPKPRLKYERCTVNAEKTIHDIIRAGIEPNDIKEISKKLSPEARIAISYAHDAAQGYTGSVINLFSWRDKLKSIPKKRVQHEIRLAVCQHFGIV